MFEESSHKHISLKASKQASKQASKLLRQSTPGLAVGAPAFTAW